MARLVAGSLNELLKVRPAGGKRSTRRHSSPRPAQTDRQEPSTADCPTSPRSPKSWRTRQWPWLPPPLSCCSPGSALSTSGWSQRLPEAELRNPSRLPGSVSGGWRARASANLKQNTTMGCNSFSFQVAAEKGAIPKNAEKTKNAETTTAKGTTEKLCVASAESTL